MLTALVSGACAGIGLPVATLVHLTANPVGEGLQLTASSSIAAVLGVVGALLGLLLGRFIVGMRGAPTQPRRSFVVEASIWIGGIAAVGCLPVLFLGGLHRNAAGIVVQRLACAVGAAIVLVLAAGRTRVRSAE